MRDCRAGLDASVRPDLFYPRFPRCARLASTTQRMQSRGRSPRTIGRRVVTASGSSHPATFVSHPAVGGGVLDAPCAGLLPSWVRRSRLAWPTAPTSSTVRKPRVHRPTYPIPRAPPAHHFLRAHRRYPSPHAGRAWKPSPTVGGAVDGQRGCDAPMSASTPQSRPFGPRQLPFQGSREGGVRRADVIRSPASSATPQSRRSAYSTLIFSAVMSFIVGQLAMVIMYSSSARLVLA